MFSDVAAAALLLQSCPTLCDSMGYSPPGSSVPGILWARALEWVAMPSPRGSSQPRDRIQVSCIAADSLLLSHQGNPYFLLLYANSLPVKVLTAILQLPVRGFISSISTTNGTPLQYSCRGKSHGLRSLVGCSPWGREESDTTERLHFHALEKEMATHSSLLAWRIPGMEELGGLRLWGCTESDTTEATEPPLPQLPMT